MTRSDFLFYLSMYIPLPARIGHLILCFAFCGERRPNRKQILILIASSVLLLAPGIITTDDPAELIPSAIYYVLLLSMTVFSFLKGQKAFRDALLFMASDLLFLLCEVLNAPAWLFFISMGAYYSGAVLLASDAYGEETPVRRTDDVLPKEMDKSTVGMRNNQENSQNA